jgi:HEAT repeat protein
VPVEKVDLTLRYFLGPRGKAEFVFTGPFAVDRMVQPDGGQDCQLTPLRSPFENGTEFRLVTSLPFDMNTPVLAYDTSGRRHLVYAGGGRSGGSGANLKYTLADLPLGEVATVTIGEQPRERTFHDIAVAYPDRPARDHAEYLDALAERLGRTNMSPKQIADRPFSSPMDVVRSIDLLRESLIAQAVRTLESGRPDFDLSELDALLDGDNREGASTAAYALSSYAQQLSAADIGTIKDVLLRRCDRAVLRPLMSCLRTSEHPAATEALWELAGTEDERPWLWWPAVELLANKRVVGDLASLPEGLRARAALVLGWQERGGGAGATPHALLPRLLTAELLERDTDVFREVLRRLCERVDRRVATEAMVGFLRTARDESRTRWALVRVVQQINRWYGVDIGQLGSDIYHEPSDMRALGVPAIVSAAVEWYDGLPEGGPPIPGEGKLYAGQPLDHWLDLLATGAAEGRVPALPAGAAAAAVLALDEGRPEIRATAAEALKAIGGPAVAALTKAVKDGRPPLRVAALSVLGEMRSDAVDALPAIIGGLRDDDQQVRNGAFVAFVQVGPAAPDVVLAATQDADAAVRRAAIDVLSGVLRSSRDENLAGRALPILIAALSDDVTRHDACQALDAMGPRAAPAVPALIGVLETQRRDVAARALGRIGPAAKPAAPALLKLLKDPGRWVPCSAAWALAWICPEDEEVVAACAPVLANVLADAIDREATPEAQWAEEALGLFGPAARVALPQLKQALTSRLAAESRYSYELPTLCWALARLDPKDAESARLCMPFLLASLEPERSIGVRMQAIQALDEFGPLAADAVPDLVSEPWNPRGGSLRDGAAEALGRIGPAARSAVPVLREALKDEYEHVRFRAAIALARIADDDPEVIGEIVPLLRQAAQAQPPAERLPIMDRFEWPFGTPKEPLEYATIRAQAAEALARLAPD